jgi:hypothetical protein
VYSSTDDCPQEETKQALEQKKRMVERIQESIDTFTASCPDAYDMPSCMTFKYRRTGIYSSTLIIHKLLLTGKHSYSTCM